MTLISYKPSKSYQNRGLCATLFALIALFFLTACGASAALDNFINNLNLPPEDVRVAQTELAEKITTVEEAEAELLKAAQVANDADAGNDANAQIEANANLLKAAEALRTARAAENTARINEQKVIADALEKTKADALIKANADKEAAAQEKILAEEIADPTQRTEALKQAEESETAADEATQTATQQVARVVEFQRSRSSIIEESIGTPPLTAKQILEAAKAQDLERQERERLEAERLEAERLERQRQAAEIGQGTWRFYVRQAQGKNLPNGNHLPGRPLAFQNLFVYNVNGENTLDYAPSVERARNFNFIGEDGLDNVDKRADILGTTTLAGGFSYINGLWRRDTSYYLDSIWTKARRNYYATIHPDTNVGNVIPQTAVTAKWKGNFSAITSETWAKGNPNRDTIVNGPFVMDIDFNARTLNATIPYTYYNIHSYKFVIQGKYNKDGYVDGRILNRWHDDNVGDFGDGNLSGLIGDRGAVVVFVADTREDDFRGKHFGYSGGFIACPTVNNQGTGACKAKQE